MQHATFCRALLSPASTAPAGLIDACNRPAGRRFDVYRNNVAVSLCQALEAGFPATARLIGTENFAHVARQFLRNEQPDTPIMMHYGKGFAGFLETIPDLSHLGYLPDVARLEYALRRSYHAADHAPLDHSRLTDLTLDRLEDAQLTLAPAVAVVRSAWPVLQIYHYTLTPDSPKPTAQADDVLITRPALDPLLHRLPAGGAAFVTALQQGVPLGAALEVATTERGAVFDPSATLSLLMTQSALTDLTTI